MKAAMVEAAAVSSGGGAAWSGSRVRLSGLALSYQRLHHGGLAGVLRREGSSSKGQIKNTVSRCHHAVGL